MKVLEIEFNEGLDAIKHFIPKGQVNTLKSIFRGEESIYAVQTVQRLAGIVKAMPVTYQTEEVEESEKIVHLHYFYANCHWYIIEKDKGESELGDEEQYQAFGYVIFHGDMINAEWGYVSIQEIVESGMIELDFHFNPTRFGDIL